MKRSILLCLFLASIAVSFIGCSKSSDGGMDLGSGTGYYDINGARNDIATSLTYSDSEIRLFTFAPYEVADVTSISEYICITIPLDLIGSSRNVVKTPGIVFEYCSNGTYYSTASKDASSTLPKNEGSITNGTVTVIPTDNGFNISFNVLLSNKQILTGTYSGRPGVLSDDPRGNIGGGDEGGGDEDEIIAQSKDAIMAAFVAINTKANEYREGTLYRFPSEYFTVEAKESNTYVENYFFDFVNTVRAKLGTTVDFSSIDTDKRFNLASFASKYEWNNETKDWDKSDLEYLRLEYPSSEELTSNDCQMSIASYEDALCKIGDKDVYLPTKVSASLKKDDVAIDSLNASASYNENGLVNSLSSIVFVQPLRVTASLSQENSSKFSASLEVDDQDGGSNSMKIQSDIVLKEGVTAYTNFDNCDLTSLKATLIKDKLTISGTIDLSSIDASTSIENLNAAMNFDVTYNSIKLGTLSVSEVDGKRVISIVYIDETTANSTISYDDFISNIRAIFKN